MRTFGRLFSWILVLIILLSCRTLTGGYFTPVPQATENQEALPTSVGTPSGPASPLPALTGDWKISFTQSGGLMGISRRMDISSSGEMTLTDLRTNQNTVSRLTQSNLTDLVSQVAEAKYYPVTTPSACADCFMYELLISSAGQKFQVKLDQTALPDSGLQSLVDYLMQLQSNSTK